MRRVFALAVFLSAYCTHAQYEYQYQRLNNMRELRIAAPLYDTDVDMHTSIHPLDIWEVDSVDPGIRNWDSDLAYPVEGWFWRVIFNENLLKFKGENYSLRIDPLVNLQLGHDPLHPTDEALFVNTRGFNIEGRIGKRFSFQTSYLENQARFPSYIAEFTRNQNVVPGQGYQREFKETGFDFGMASGQISYTPDEFFSFSLGHGRNFLGEGYRSVMLSDVAYNYPFFRIETDFWRIKYVNLWAQLYDVGEEAYADGVFDKKYMSSHYLSINLTDRWNWSFFETIILGDRDQQRGIDVSFFNPIIFYRPVEFAIGSRGGNALLGTGTSYKLMDGLQVYSQFILDEFSLEAFTKQEGGWQNKYAWQTGVKYYDAFEVPGLFTRLEYNGARPYTYGHREPISNYGHYGQPLAHPWGANFHEGLAQVVYQWGRWEAEARVHLALVGLDTDTMNYGGDIYRSYQERVSDTGNEVAQGETGSFSYLYLRAAWLVNPVRGMKLEAGVRLRNLDASAENTRPLPSGQSNYFFVGLRTEFFNNYYDF